MNLKRNKLYLILILACTAGYLWLSIANISASASGNCETGVCMFKHVMHIPCPSCGTTRSILSLSKGDFSGSLHWNPIGLILIALMIISPIWIVYDLVIQNDSLFRFYHQAELFLKRTWVAIPAILLVLANWVWNIQKGL
jgi:hypothetical protein